MGIFRLVHDDCEGFICGLDKNIIVKPAETLWMILLLSFMHLSLLAKQVFLEVDAKLVKQITLSLNTENNCKKRRRNIVFVCKYS